MTITRTYETFTIQWANGSRWSGYDKLELAQDQLSRSSRQGTIERRTFDVSFDASLAYLYQPGIAEVTR